MKIKKFFKYIAISIGSWLSLYTVVAYKAYVYSTPGGVFNLSDNNPSDKLPGNLLWVGLLGSFVSLLFGILAYYLGERNK